MKIDRDYMKQWATEHEVQAASDGKGTKLVAHGLPVDPNTINTIWKVVHHGEVMHQSASLDLAIEAYEKLSAP